MDNNSLKVIDKEDRILRLKAELFDLQLKVAQIRQEMQVKIDILNDLMKGDNGGTKPR